MIQLPPQLQIMLAYAPVDFRQGIDRLATLCGSVARTASELSSALRFSHQSPGIILLKQNKSSFKWCHYEPTIILLCVRWYCRLQLSYRDVEEMIEVRGLDVHHSTVFRQVQRYAPEINKRVRQHLKMSGTFYRVDETYILRREDM